MDSLQRVRRFLPARVSNRLSFLVPSEAPGSPPVHADWRDLPRASVADRLAFGAILIGFAIVFIPALILAGAAMILIRLYSLIINALRGGDIRGR
jgi:hypothetical protein